MPRSRGSIEFARMPGGIVKISERLGAGASKSSVSAWRRGDSDPSSAMRERIFELGGPDPDAWDEPHEPRNLALASLGQLPPASAADTATEADLLLAEIRRLRQDPNVEQLDVAQKGRLLQSLTAMVDKLGHHTGTKISERQILDAPAVVVVVDRLLEALEPWPEAMRAAADAISELKAKL